MWKHFILKYNTDINNCAALERDRHESARSFRCPDYDKEVFNCSAPAPVSQHRFPWLGVLSSYFFCCLSWPGALVAGSAIAVALGEGHYWWVARGAISGTHEVPVFCSHSQRGLILPPESHCGPQAGDSRLHWAGRAWRILCGVLGKDKSGVSPKSTGLMFPLQTSRCLFIIFFYFGGSLSDST